MLIKLWGKEGSYDWNIDPKLAGPCEVCLASCAAFRIALILSIQRNTAYQEFPQEAHLKCDAELSLKV